MTLLKLRRDEKELDELFEKVDIEKDGENDSDYSIHNVLFFTIKKSFEKYEIEDPL